jgi:hypothetical protein
MPGARFARLVMIVVAALVVLGLILSAVYSPRAI